MKRILTSFALVAASVAFSQVSISGETNDTPKATLDVKAIDNGKANGILIPRVTKAVADGMPNPENASAIEESTLIYITGDVSGSANNYATNVDANGFYYFKDGKWVKLGGGAATTGELNMGAVTGNLKVISGEVVASDWGTDVYTIIGTGDPNDVSLPNPGGANTNRIIHFRNQSPTQRNFAGSYQPVDNTTIRQKRGMTLQSDGEKWYVIAGF